MKSCLVFLLFLFSFYSAYSHPPAGVDKPSTKQRRELGLYNYDDNVVILTDKNINRHLLYKECLWVIEFYNSWCGHCVKFAPTWKLFGTYTKGWESVISVGAIDCSKANNTATCRKFDKSGYPTIMYFKPRFSNRMLNKTEIKGDEVLSGGRSIEDLVRNTHKFIDKIADKVNSLKWPKLEPLRNIEEIWEEAKDEHEYVFLIFEKEGYYLGREVILDTMNNPKCLVRRMLENDVKKFGINHFPSLYSLNKEGIYKKVMFGDPKVNNRGKFVKAISEYTGISSDRQIFGQMEKNKGEEEKEKDVDKVSVDVKQDEPPSDNTQYDNTPVAVYMADLESALHYSLMQEVAIKNTIKGEALTSLQHFIAVLLKYFPGNTTTLTYLMRLNEWLQSVNTDLTGEAWVDKLSAIQDDEAHLSEEQQWIGCAGSEVMYRGYPCGMWTLFHTLTVAAHLSPKRSNPQEVLLAVRGYMKNFFGCEECSQNFYKMAATLEEEVRQTSDSVLWLWRAHNKANKRLQGEPSEDPQHPKIQFPSSASCPTCHTGSEWDENAVLSFLVALYRHDNIVRQSSEPQRAPPEEHAQAKLDWWEKKQNAHDLARVQELRQGRMHSTIPRQRIDGTLGRMVRGDYGLHPDPLASARRGWSLNGIDLGMCMMFYVMCAVIILLMYYHFTVRRNWKPCGCLPL